MANSSFTPAVLTLPGSTSGSGSGEINAILNPSVATDTTGWTGVTRLTSGSPLDPIITTAISISSSDGSETPTSGGYFTFSMPTALRNKKLKAEFQFIGITSGSAKLSLYKGGSTRVNLTTDSSGVTTLPNGMTGKFTTYFDADDSETYSLNLTRITGAIGDLVVTNVIVGPGIQPQGAVVEEWQSYTPTLTGFGSKGTTLLAGKYRRVGETAEIKIHYVGDTIAAGAGSTILQLSIPSGLTVNPSATPGPLASSGSAVGTFNEYGIKNAATYSMEQGAYAYSSTTLALLEGGTNDVFRQDDLNVARAVEIVLKATVPIAEWAGSGTVNLAQNDVEYASNSSTADANDSSSFIYGPFGSQFASFTAERLRVVRFQKPIQSTDVITVEVTSNGGTTWVPLGTADWVEPWSKQNTTQYGIIHAGVITGSTDVSVYFEAYRTAGGATYASAGGSWGTVNSNPLYKWRLKKTSAGSAVGFGIVNPGVSSGLVSASGLPGRTDGQVVPSGYVGEKIENSASSVSTSTAGFTTVTSINLTPGRWMIFGQVVSNTAGLGGLTLTEAGVSTTTNSSTGFDSLQNSSESTQTGRHTFVIQSHIIDLPSNSTRYLTVKPTGVSTNTHGRLTAIRIA